MPFVYPCARARSQIDLSLALLLKMEPQAQTRTTKITKPSLCGDQILSLDVLLLQFPVVEAMLLPMLVVKAVF